MSAESECVKSVNEIVELITLGIDDIKALRQSVDENATRLTGLLHLMSDMVKLEDQIKKMEENIEQRLSRIESSQTDTVKLVDRIIEMAMVQSGQADQAVLHRSQSGRQTVLDHPEWQGLEDDPDVWPPPGYDAMTG